MNLSDWKGKQRIIRRDLLACLGDMPSPAKLKARTLEKRQEHGKIIEKFCFENGIGDPVPGYFVRPEKVSGKCPAILFLHCHGGNYEIGKTELFQGFPGLEKPHLDEFISRGYAVAAIDYYCFEERRAGHSFAPKHLSCETDEMSAFKQFLWEGKTLWGMMVQDQILALDYLCSRREVDTDRIGVLGFSMGGTMAWWLPAIDRRIKVSVSVCCLTRYEELIRTGGCHLHSIYYYVPGIRKKYDTENIVALIAPGPFLALNGRTDAGSPVAGIEEINRHAGKIYGLYGCPASYKNIIFNCGHLFTEEMWQASFDWFARHF